MSEGEGGREPKKKSASLLFLVFAEKANKMLLVYRSKSYYIIIGFNSIVLANVRVTPAGRDYLLFCLPLKFPYFVGGGFMVGFMRFFLSFKERNLSCVMYCQTKLRTPF